MARYTFPVLQSDVEHADLALTNYNDWEAKKERAQLHSPPYKAKKIRLISKEKSSCWDEKSTVNLYSYTISYPSVEALFYFAEQLGVAKAVALAQQVYGKEVVGG